LKTSYTKLAIVTCPVEKHKPASEIVLKMQSRVPRDSLWHREEKYCCE